MAMLKFARRKNYHDRKSTRTEWLLRTDMIDWQSHRAKTELGVISQERLRFVEVQCIKGE